MDDIFRVGKKPLNYPVENLHLHRFGCPQYRVSVASMMGLRDYMEDRYCVSLEMKNHKDTAFFGVFDGHSGAKTSEWLATDHLLNAIDNLESFSEEQIKTKLLELDQQYYDATGDLHSGSTAVFCFVQKTDVDPAKPFEATVVNVGDSRCYVGHHNTPDFTRITNDHKPQDPEEQQRIKAAGGFVLRGRIDSKLSVSRSFGDFYYKARKDLPPDKQKVVAVPDIFHLRLGPEDFIFLCSDGVLFSQDSLIFKFLYEKLSINNIGITTDTTTTTSMMDTCSALSCLFTKFLKSGSVSDNMTAIFVEFKNGDDFNAGREFVPGHFYEFGNLSYLEAFTRDCERNGKTFPEVKEISQRQQPQQQQEQQQQEQQEEQQEQEQLMEKGGDHV